MSQGKYLGPRFKQHRMLLNFIALSLHVSTKQRSQITDMKTRPQLFFFFKKKQIRVQLAVLQANILPMRSAILERYQVIQLSCTFQDTRKPQKCRLTPLET